MSDPLSTGTVSIKVDPGENDEVETEPDIFEPIIDQDDDLKPDIKPNILEPMDEEVVEEPASDNEEENETDNAGLVKQEPGGKTDEQGLFIGWQWQQPGFQLPAC